MLRDVRARNHFTDNKTLDCLDECLKVVEMSEGRRDRRDDKSFPDLFKEAIEEVNKQFNEVAPIWQKSFNSALQEMLAEIRKNTKANA